MQKPFYFIVRDILGKRRNKHIEKRKKGYYLYMTYRISSWLSCNIFLLHGPLQGQLHKLLQEV